MKFVIAIVRPNRADEVRKALSEVGVRGMTVTEAKGYGRQKGYLDRYAGGEYSLAYLPKVEITVWVSDDRADVVAEGIVSAARTGRIGDGKILLVDVAGPGVIEF